MSSTKTILIITAIFMAAAFVGVVSDAVDAEGEETETSPFKISYIVGDMTYQFPADASGQVTLKTLPDLGATVPSGKSFAGWTSAEGTTYTAGSVITLTADTTLTAKLTDITYTVKFVADGKAVGEDVKGIYGTEITAPEAPVKDGYTFKGWLATGAEETVTDIPAISGDMTYTAVYVVDYTVKFVVGETTISTMTVSTMEVPPNPSKEGFEFRGWSVDGEVVDVSKYKIESDTVFVAEFRADTYTVKFVAGDITLAVVTVEYGSKVVTPNVEFPDGYLGWDFDFSTPITDDAVIEAKEYTAPASEPTGLGDWKVQCALIIVAFLVGFLIWAYRNDKLPITVSRKGGKKQ